MAKRLGSTEIANILRRDIGAGVLGPRERLPAERLLAESYGVARGTIRDALGQLVEDGLVEIRAGSGTYVRGPRSFETSTIIEDASPLELMDARFALEPHICRLAVLHATRQDLDRAEQLLMKMEASVHDHDQFSHVDLAFHRLLAEATRNRLLVWVVSQVNIVRNQEQWKLMINLTLNERIIRQYNDQHRSVVDAIRERSPEKAATLMKEHLETARLSLTRAAAT